MKSAAREIDPLDLAHKLSSAPRLWLFLDYDGTLADFAPTPDTLTPDLGLIDLLARLAALPNVRIAVISGRKLSHIQSLLPIPGIWLAGTYGADLLTPDGQIMHCLDLPSIRPILDFLKPRWNELIAGKDGFFLEDKDWSLALHARFAAPDQAEAILAQARGLIPSPLPEFLQILEGDRFLEIAPADVDKARTVEKLLSDYPWPGANLVYAGDDDKDELAFQVIKEHGGFTIAIADRIAQSDFFLASPKQVRMLLMELVKLKYNHLIGM